METEELKQQESECLECRGTGWSLVRRDGTETVESCPKCGAKDRIGRLLRMAQIPPRYGSRGFDAYSIHHPLQEEALKRSIEYVSSFPQVPRGLLFCGPCGVGKTHLAVAVLKQLVQEKQIRTRFIDETELLRRLQYSYGPDSPETEREVLLPLFSVDLLVWDDLGTGRPTEWVAETIRTILNHRYTYEKQTVLTTNLPLKSAESQYLRGEPIRTQNLAERIGQRLYSRIMEMCRIVEIDGPDARTEIHKAGMDFQQA